MNTTLAALVASLADVQGLARRLREQRVEGRTGRVMAVPGRREALP